jgi:hypothetical protein
MPTCRYTELQQYILIYTYRIEYVDILPCESYTNDDAVGEKLSPGTLTTVEVPSKIIIA